MMGIYSHIFNVYIIRITIHYKLATFPVINSKNINMRQTQILSKKYSNLHIFKYTISHTVLGFFFNYSNQGTSNNFQNVSVMTFLQINLYFNFSNNNTHTYN